MVCSWVAAERTQKRKHVSLGQNKEPGGKEGECKVKICRWEGMVCRMADTDWWGTALYLAQGYNQVRRKSLLAE